MNRDSIRTGINPLTWLNSDFPDLGADISLDQCLSEAALAGYVGVELEDRLRIDVEGTRAKMAARGLSAIGGWHSTHLLERGLEASVEALHQHLDVLSAFDAQVAILAECSWSVHREPNTPLSQRPRLDDEQWQRLCADLDKLAMIAGERGFTVAYHHHMGTVVQDSEDIARLMEGTQRLGLLYDTGHLLFAGVDPLSCLMRHRDRITHVHYKNIREGVLSQVVENDSPFLEAVTRGAFTVPGDGVPGRRLPIDFPSITRELIDTDYRGWIVVEAEQDPERADPFTYARLGAVSVQAMVTQARVSQSLPPAEGSRPDAALAATGSPHRQ